MEARLLVVDDEESILFAMHDYFGSLGYKVECARNMATAKALLRDAEYALMIADLRLGGSDSQDGLKIVACMRERFPKTRIVLLTAYGSPAVAAEARTRGADIVLNKPVSLPKLARLMNDLLGSRHD